MQKLYYYKCYTNYLIYITFKLHGNCFPKRFSCGNSLFKPLYVRQIIAVYIS